MADVSVKDMAARLLSDGFGQGGPRADMLSDPVADTQVVVTLDELRPYELDPRLTRNPLYAEIKTSISERGLDAPPPITRRPGADYYIIRNGGNTRLAILRELWTETRDERFYRIACIFRPWPKRGDIIALSGHLAENELHGRLTFIERALGVAKLRELYETEAGKPLSQSELARRLKADGYPVLQPHISRMQEAIEFLLPAIPNVLYAGLGRHQVEQLTALRRAGQSAWESRTAGDDTATGTDFATLFQDVIAAFDNAGRDFSVQRVQDELIGQMCEYLDAKYDTIALDIAVVGKRLQILGAEPEQPVFATSPAFKPSEKPPPVTTEAADLSPAPASPSATGREQSHSSGSFLTAAPSPDHAITQDTSQGTGEAANDHIVPPIRSTGRLDDIQRLVAQQIDEGDTAGFDDNVVKSVPVQAGGLYPVSDIWSITPALDDPARLRMHIGQLATEIASETSLGPDIIIGREDGIGYSCRSEDRNLAAAPAVFSRALLALLDALSSSSRSHDAIAVERRNLPGDLATLLVGDAQAGTVAHVQMSRLSDTGLVKLFRLIRLARRLLELEADDSPPTSQ